MKTQKAHFFQHRECEYFPCHNTEHPEDFNCLFCYCPLYTLGDKCGGQFTYTEKGVKNCRNCMRPHNRDSIRMVFAQFDKLAKLAGRSAPKGLGQGDT